VTSRQLVALGAAIAGLSVAAGAFGAHALRARLEPGDLLVFETAARYQMYHGLALIAAGWVADRWPGSPALPAPDAPTAVLLGGAADRLYRALSPARQAEFGDLPGVLRRLEADALAAGDASPIRRAEALSALEALRLDLLRMQAGEAVADQLTADLGAARQVADRVDQALEDGTRGSA